MEKRITSFKISSFLLSMAAALTSPVLADETVQLKPVVSGAIKIMGNGQSKLLRLSPGLPVAAKVLPEGLSAHTYYGTLKLPGAGTAEYTVLFDAPDDKPVRLFVDSSGDGNLTAGPPADWTAGDKLTDADALPHIPPVSVGGKGGVTLHLGTPDRPRDVHIVLWLYDRNGTGRQPVRQWATNPSALIVCRDYYTAGTAAFDDKTYDIKLFDELTFGSFSPTKDHFVTLFVDLNGDGKPANGEVFVVGKPCKLNGKVYDIADLAADGTSLRIVHSNAAAYSPEDVTVGKVAPTFDATDMSGAPVAFPAAYRGKIVLLDFWATWCGPCMAEMPNVVAAYQKFHPKGLEILGVTLDSADDSQKVKEVAAKNRMIWPQLIDDAGKSHQIASMYSVDGIPCSFLIDGSTGKILAAGDDTRGEGLEKALAAAFKGK